MGYVSFDCTQFLIFKAINESDKNEIKSNLKNFGFNLENWTEMSKKKKEFIKSHVNDSLLALELKDKSFIGEFEEWEFEKTDKVPEKINFFINLIKDIGQKTTYLKLIFVLYLYEDLKNQISSEEIHINDLPQTLYSLSPFGNSGNVLIITIKNESNSPMY